MAITSFFKEEPNNFKGFEISSPAGRTGIIQLQTLVTLTLLYKRNLI